MRLKSQNPLADTERWEQINKIFDVALALDSTDRAAYLEQACNGDELLRGEVESLLTNHDSVNNIIKSAAIEMAAPLLTDDKDDGMLHRKIGPYHILTRLGSGGMGKVYLVRDIRLGRKLA